MIKSYRYLSAIALFTTLLVTSCIEDPETFDANAQFVKDTTAIGSFTRANTNGMQIVRDEATGIVLRIQELGDRLPAGIVSNTVNTDYVGRLFPDGTVFDDNDDIKFRLDQVIPGWTRAFSLLPQGSVADIFIPSAYGYGQGSSSKIPANSILQFKVNFKEVAFTSTEKSKLKSDSTTIAQYLQENEIEAEYDTSGLFYVITQEGTGSTPGWYDNVRVRYKIRPFKSTDKVVEKDFGLISETNPMSLWGNSKVIDYVNGVKAALLKLNAGSKATLYIPSGLGYGPYSYYDPTNPSSTVPLVPAGTNFIVDLELVEIQ